MIANFKTYKISTLFTLLTGFWLLVISMAYAETKTTDGNKRTIDSKLNVKIDFDYGTYQQAPCELICNGDLSTGWIYLPVGKYAAARKWFVDCRQIDEVKVDYNNDTILIKRLKPNGAVRLRNSNIILDTTENYRFKTRVRQLNGDDGWICFAGKKLKKVQADGNWMDISYDIRIPEQNGKSNLGRSVSLLYYLPSKNGSSLEIKYASLTPIFVHNNLPKKPKVFIKQKKKNLPLKVIFVRSGATEGELLAAHSLRKSLYRYCRYIIPVCYLDNNKTSEISAIYVGTAAVEHGIIHKSELDDLDQCGYVLKSCNGVCGISGKTDSGTICGVYGLLDDCGINYLRIFKSDIALPDSNELLICEQNACRKPSFKYNGTDGYDGLGGVPFGYSWEKPFLGNPSDLGVNNAYWEHSANYLCPFEIYGKEHPEYYALNEKTGQRLQFDPEKYKKVRFHVHLCYSNPDVQKIATERLLAWIEKQKDRKYFTVSAGDGLDFCNCENCRKWDPDPKAYGKSDRYMRFLNILARAAGKKFPDKRILYLAYTARTEDPPIQVKPEPNVDVMYCLWSSDWPCKNHAYCVRNREGVENFERWVHLMPGRVHIFDYPCNTFADVKRLRYFRKRGVAGVIHCSFRGEFPDLLCWVLGKAFWDIDLNVDEEIDRFMAVYYGPAASAMRKYFDLMQNAIDLDSHAFERKGERPKLFKPLFPDRGEPFLLTFEEMDKGYDYLDTAIKAAQGNPIILARIQEFKNDLLMVDLTRRNPGKGLSGVDHATFARRLAEFLRKNCKNYLFWKKPINLWLKNIARMDVEQKNWRNDKNIKAFLANPEAWDFDKIYQDKIANGWRLSGGFSVGGEHMKYLGKECTILRPTNIRSATFSLLLPPKPSNDLKLKVWGLDDDKPGEVLLEIRVNGQTIFQGKNPFNDKKWTTIEYIVPANCWKTGMNKIEFINRTSDPGIISPKDSPEQAALKRSRRGNWGWLGISDMEVTNLK